MYASVTITLSRTVQTKQYESAKAEVSLTRQSCDVTDLDDIINDAVDQLEAAITAAAATNPTQPTK
jgi:hypothetical protein